MKARVMRVLHLVAPARVGGLESVIAQLAAGQRDAGHDVSVATVLQPGIAMPHPFLELLDSLAVPVHRILVKTREYRAERRQVRALLAALDVDVLHTHGYRSDVLDGRLAQQMGRVHVTTLHGFTGGDWRNRLYEWLQVRAAARADAVIAVSKPIAERLSRMGIGAKTHLVRNASRPDPAKLSRTESRQALDLPNDAFVVGWVGRLSHEKGPDVFVEALALTAQHIHGVLIGDGPMLESVRELARSKGLQERVHFTGMRAQASRYLSAFDALALTSRTEGTPMILLEAMWAEVPILATSVGGVPDVVSARESILCEPASAESIAHAIDALCIEPARGEQLSARALERVSTAFGIESWIGAHVQLYQGAVNALSAGVSRRRQHV